MALRPRAARRRLRLQKQLRLFGKAVHLARQQAPLRGPPARRLAPGSAPAAACFLARRRNRPMLLDGCHTLWAQLHAACRPLFRCSAKRIGKAKTALNRTRGPMGGTAFLRLASLALCSCRLRFPVIAKCTKRNGPIFPFRAFPFASPRKKSPARRESSAPGSFCCRAINRSSG